MEKDFVSGDVYSELYLASVAATTQAPKANTLTFIGLGMAGLYSRIRRDV